MKSLLRQVASMNLKQILWRSFGWKSQASERSSMNGTLFLLRIRRLRTDFKIPNFNYRMCDSRWNSFHNRKNVKGFSGFSGQVKIKVLVQFLFFQVKKKYKGLFIGISVHSGFNLSQNICFLLPKNWTVVVLQMWYRKIIWVKLKNQKSNVRLMVYFYSVPM